MLEHWPEFLIILAREGYLYVIVLYFSPKGIETLFQAVRNSGVMCVSDGQALGRTQTYLWEAAFFGANSYSSGYQRLHTAKMELSKETVSNTLNNYVLQVVYKSRLVGFGTLERIALSRGSWKRWHFCRAVVFPTTLSCFWPLQKNGVVVVLGIGGRGEVAREGKKGKKSMHHETRN